MIGLFWSLIMKTRILAGCVVLERARQREGGHPVERFRVGKGGANGLVFGYGALDEGGIVEGLGRLRGAFGR